MMIMYMSSIQEPRLRSQSVRRGIFPLLVRHGLAQVEIFLLLGQDVNLQRHRAENCLVYVVRFGDQLGFFPEQRLEAPDQA
jgi:hypothetical protein